MPHSVRIKYKFDVSQITPVFKRSYRSLFPTLLVTFSGFRRKIRKVVNGRTGIIRNQTFVWRQLGMVSSLYPTIYCTYDSLGIPRGLAQTALEMAPTTVQYDPLGPSLQQRLLFARSPLHHLHTIRM